MQVAVGLGSNRFGHSEVILQFQVLLDLLLNNALERSQSHLVQIHQFVLRIPSLLDFRVQVVVVFVEALFTVTLFGDSEGFRLDVELSESCVVGVGVLSDLGNWRPIS